MISSELYEIKPRAVQIFNENDGFRKISSPIEYISGKMYPLWVSPYIWMSVRPSSEPHKSQVKSTPIILLYLVGGWPRPMMTSMIGVRTESVNIISKQVRREGRHCHVWEHMSVYSYAIRLSLRLWAAAA